MFRTTNWAKAASRLTKRYHDITLSPVRQGQKPSHPGTKLCSRQRLIASCTLLRWVLAREIVENGVLQLCPQFGLISRRLDWFGYRNFANCASANRLLQFATVGAATA